MFISHVNSIDDAIPVLFDVRRMENINIICNTGNITRVPHFFFFNNSNQNCVRIVHLKTWQLLLERTVCTHNRQSHYNAYACSVLVFTQEIKSRGAREKNIIKIHLFKRTRYRRPDRRSFMVFYSKTASHHSVVVHVYVCRL